MALDFYGATKKPQAPIKASDTSKGQMVGYLTTGQLNDPQWGFGTSFQAAAKQGGIQALKDSFSDQNADDAAAQGQLRDYYTQSLGGLGKLGDMRGTALDTQMQTGLGNLLQQYKNTNAGTGRIGTSQYGRGQGDITQRLASEYTKGLADLSGQQLQNAGMIGQGLGSINQQGLQERAFQNKQANDLAGYYAQQQNMDLGRDSGINALKQQEAAANQAFWGSIIGAAGQAGGAMLGKPPTPGGGGGGTGTVGTGMSNSGYNGANYYLAGPNDWMGQP